MSQNATPSYTVLPPFKFENAVTDRLVHLIPDELAEKCPEHSLFAYPKTNSPKDGFIEVSAKSFANAINRTAWYLESTLGKAPEGFPCVGYMGSSDLRYFLFLFGAIKAGYKMLYLAPKNSVAGHLNVLEKADCNIFLTARGTQADHFLSQRTMRTEIAPELEELLDETSVEVYPYTKSFAEARKDPCLVLHTTGSTGLPKPITWKNEILSTYEAWRTIPSVDGYVPMTEVYQEGQRAYNSMPLFHTSGLNVGITMSLLLGVTCVFGSPNVVPNLGYADEMHKYAGVDVSIGPPSIYEDLSHNPESLERLHSLRYILVCGAPLSQIAGDIISEHTRVISNFGATETAVLQRLAPSVEDWGYFYWHPTHSGIEMREYMDGLYELFIVRDAKLDLYQGIFSTFPEIQEYSMNDIYSKHPDPAKPFLYKWRGRADDVIVLSNGEKLAPALMEASLRTSDLVKGAMVVGHGEFQPAALVDLGEAPPATSAERHALIKQLLPAINEANKHAPAHGQLDALHILFVDPERPVHYLGQGKIQRRITFGKYERDFKKLYAAADNFDEEDEGEATPKVDFSDRENIRSWLGELAAEVAALPDLKGEESFFEAGMDSLHVIRFVRELKIQAKLVGGESLKPATISAAIIYSHPSLDQLATFLFKKADLGPKGIDSAYQSDAEDEDAGVSTKEMEALLDKYVQTLPIIDHSRPHAHAERQTVLLTGSTGSLGSYLLDQLNRDPNVEHIICLDRNDAGAEKYEESKASRGLASVSPKRVEFLKANLADAELGLGSETYGRILATVTHVIHCQWPVNFNWSLSSFKPYIEGVRNLANMAAHSTHNAFVLFVSSVAAVGGWKSAEDVPEAPIHDLSAAANLGYGQSKKIAEVLLDKAAEISGVRAAICRVGIVAGPVQQELGMWNKHEYIPSIMVSSAHLGVFPETFPSRDNIDWLPVDKLSQILVEILDSASKDESDDEAIADVESNEPHGAKTYHVVNPHTASWSADLSGHLKTAYSTGTVTPVPFDSWLEKLKDSVEEAETSGNIDVEHNPAMRLVDFYEGAATASAEKGRRKLPTDASERASKTLRELGPLDGSWLRNWMVQWGVNEA
ncbi:thioester reductase domain-containing protein [Phlyctema vagabunda]|uniref:Thioester reductase domain-containing protein n=1 Tax=Phlyctema vagabunda TaxID=108571 RepID=A0ABR4P3T0_9HELO